MVKVCDEMIEHQLPQIELRLDLKLLNYTVKLMFLHFISNCYFSIISEAKRAQILLEVLILNAATCFNIWKTGERHDNHVKRDPSGT